MSYLFHANHQTSNRKRLLRKVSWITAHKGIVIRDISFRDSPTSGVILAIFQLTDVLESFWKPPFRMWIK